MKFVKMIVNFIDISMKSLMKFTFCFIIDKRRRSLKMVMFLDCFDTYNQIIEKMRKEERGGRWRGREKKR